MLYVLDAWCDVMFQASMSRLELGDYPKCCIPSSDQEEDEDELDNLFKRLHSCDGRPA